MTGAAAETIAVVLLAASLVFAVVRPRGLSELVVVGPAAVLVVALGIVPTDDALDTLREIGPTIGFLAAILVFGHLCEEAGVFAYLGAVAARASAGDARRLLLRVVVLAAVVTAILTLDATVVLLTPVVLIMATHSRLPVRPHAYACTRLANSASLLLPVSNLTNLLAFGSSGLSFMRFASLMALPWLLVCVGEWAVLRTWFRTDLRPAGTAVSDIPPVPRYAFGVLAATVVLIVATSTFHVAPAWAAIAGCVALLVPRALRHDVRPMRILAEASPGFCLFVLALAVVVDGVTRHGLGAALDRLLASGTSFWALLGIAFIAAVLANLVNNLPATLALVPIVAGQPAAILAVLLGVNIGPNATYPGSLATLLWRRLLPDRDKPNARQFHALGLSTVPVLLLIAVAGLWLALEVIGT